MFEPILSEYELIYYLKWVLYVIATDPGTITTIQGFGFFIRKPGLFQPAHNSPRDKREQSRKQARKIAQETTRYNSPVNPTCIGMNTSVQPVRKSRQQRNASTGWSDVWVGTASVQPVLSHRMIRQNQNQRRCCCPEGLKNAWLTLVKPMKTKP